jgi:ankyrin repeat protein
MKCIFTLCIALLLSTLSINPIEHAQQPIAVQAWVKQLTWAAREGEMGRLRSLLAQMNAIPEASIHSVDYLGATALTHAVANNHPALAQYLVEHYNADVNHADSFGYTPLMYAAFNGNKDIVRYLVAHGASIDAKDAHGNTARDLAVQQRHAHIAQLLQKKRTR